MGSAPPPYSPQDARWQARQMKEAARAQRDQWKAQARAQKDYYKACWRGARRPSFVGPIVLLTIGIVALLLCTGRIDWVEFWGWYAHWWPMLIIGLGGLLLVEYFLDLNSPWAGRRPMGGIIWLVILMICLGGISREGHLVGPFAWNFDGGNGDDFWSWMGPEHDNDVQIDQALTGAKPSVSISDPHGDVTLTPSNDGQMHIRAHQMVHRTSDSEAKRLFNELKPKLETSSNGAVITVPLAEEMAFRGFLLRRLASSDFEAVSWRRFSWLPFLISSAAFGLLHGERWLAGTVAGMIYALVMIRRGRIGEAVAASGC